jgi:hypothetical protein
VFRRGVPAEYSGEEQAIYAVGLAKARPGVFNEAIQHLLVLATPCEVQPPLSLASSSIIPVTRPLRRVGIGTLNRTLNETIGKPCATLK